jgi:hypothetical protein
METVLIISFAIFAAYILYVFYRYGARPSLSDSFYSAGYLFTGWCFVIGISVTAIMLELSEGKWYQFLAFLAGSGLCLVGAAPRFKDYERVTHYVGAATCAVTALAWMVLFGLWYIPAATLVVAAVLSAKRPRSQLLWFELALFVAAYAVFGVEIFLGG